MGLSNLLSVTETIPVQGQYRPRTRGGTRETGHRSSGPRPSIQQGDFTECVQDQPQPEEAVVEVSEGEGPSRAGELP